MQPLLPQRYQKGSSFLSFVDSLRLEEHMLGTAEADTLSAKLHCVLQYQPVYLHWYERRSLRKLSAQSMILLKFPPTEAS